MTYEDYGRRADKVAIESKNQCEKCGHMTSDTCTKWKYNKSHVVGKRNMAPWCQFFSINSDIDKETCPHCNRPF